MVSYSNFVFCAIFATFAFEKYLDFDNQVGVIEGHCKRHNHSCYLS